MEDLGPPLLKPASHFIKYNYSSAPDCFSLSLCFWNCEGISRNRLALQHIFNGFADIVCLSEVNGSDFTINLVLQEYHDIKFCSSNEIESNFGRSAILWKSHLDPIITQYPCPSHNICCIKIANDSTSPIYLASLYMPTAGKDTLFVDVLAELSNLFSDIYELVPDAVILIGGDLNNNFKNKPRYTIWTHFLAQYQVAQIELTKPTYHHHIGDGVFDSFIDSALLINPPPKCIHFFNPAIMSPIHSFTRQ